eukprot:TRINITY_DN7622_c1_g1_i2.p1 TRINITY_DN7622_c1_g1~~TRINITY_DN7622_c1_g1_i2.p1  ORF type:complete len:192 (+),score=37.75 TRINITY_DN7622_c1_g1_i2:61-636(+)
MKVRKEKGGDDVGKLPPSWKDYRKLLKRDWTIKTIEDLLQNLQIEDEARKRDKIEDEAIGKIKSLQDKVHMIEQKEKEPKEKDKEKKNNSYRSGNKSKNNKRNRNQNHSNFRSKNKQRGREDSKKNKGSGPCYVCGKMGQIARQCRYRKGQEKESNHVEDEFVAVISEVFMVNNDNGWWIDSGSTCHVTPH